MAVDLLPLSFPGVVPSRQKRSRATSEALLRAGAEMLRTHRLEELSIEGLCAKVEASVGAFYSRFESKDAYFNALLGLAAHDGEARLARLAKNSRLATLSLDLLCDALIQGVIDWMRAHEGVVRAALHRGDGGARWHTFKDLGRSMVARTTPLLLCVLGTGRRSAKETTIGFGFQVIFGVLVNAILNDPGPFSLHDKGMAKRLSQCLLLLLQTESAGPKTARDPPSRRRKVQDKAQKR